MDAKEMTSVEQRLRALEDQIAIYQIVCGYCYAVDGLNSEAVGQLYAPDGVYAVADYEPKVGRDAIAAMAPAHVDQVRSGCAHVASLPYVVIAGDRASATCNTLLIRKNAEGFHIVRLSASRLELSREPGGGWQIDHRQNYLLNGDMQGPELLARLLKPPAAATA